MGGFATGNKPGIIYLAVNRINQKAYIGLTTRTLNYRRSGHKNVHRQVFHLAVKKYGFESFDWAILEKLPTLEALNEAEKKWIARLGSIAPTGYNVAHGGGGTVGVPLSAKRKEQLSALRRGVPSWNAGMKMGPEWMTEEHKKKLSSAHKKRYLENGHHMTGKTTPEHVRAKMSKTHIDRGTNRGDKNGMHGVTGEAHPRFGKTHSAGALKANKEKHQALWGDPEYRERQRKAHLGIKHSPEHRKRISEALRAFYKSKKESA